MVEPAVVASPLGKAVPSVAIPPPLDAPTVMGVESFALGQVNLRMVARTLAGKQFEVERRLRALVAEAFHREGIGVDDAPARKAHDV